jgi:hypothetical protein
MMNVCVCMYIHINKYDMGILHNSCNVFLLFFHFRHYTYYSKETGIVSNLDDNTSVWDTDTGVSVCVDSLIRTFFSTTEIRKEVRQSSQPI